MLLSPGGLTIRPYSVVCQRLALHSGVPRYREKGVQAVKYMSNFALAVDLFAAHRSRAIDLLTLLAPCRLSATAGDHHAIREYLFRLSNVGQEKRVRNVASKRGHHDDVGQRMEDEAVRLGPVPP